MYVILTSRPGEFRSEPGPHMQLRESWDYLFCGRLRAQYLIAQVEGGAARVRIIDASDDKLVNDVPVKFLPTFQTLQDARQELDQLTRFGKLDVQLIPTKADVVSRVDSKAQVQITFAKESERTVTAPADSNLLRVSLREKGGIPFKCGGGLCGTCKCRITAGLEYTDAIKAKERKHLSEEQFAQGWRMACQTFVSGDVTVTW